MAKITIKELYYGDKRLKELLKLVARNRAL